MRPVIGQYPRVFVPVAGSFRCGGPLLSYFQHELASLRHGYVRCSTYCPQTFELRRKSMTRTAISILRAWGYSVAGPIGIPWNVAQWRVHIGTSRAEWYGP